MSNAIGRCGGDPFPYSVNLDPDGQEGAGVDITLSSESGLDIVNHASGERFNLAPDMKLTDRSSFWTPGTTLADLAALDRASFNIGGAKITVARGTGPDGAPRIDQVVVTSFDRSQMVVEESDRNWKLTGASCGDTLELASTPHAVALDAKNPDGAPFNLRKGAIDFVHDDRWPALEDPTIAQIARDEAGRRPQAGSTADDLIDATGLGGEPAQALRHLMGPTTTVVQVLGHAPPPGQDWPDVLTSVVDKLKVQARDDGDFGFVDRQVKDVLSEFRSEMMAAP